MCYNVLNDLDGGLIDMIKKILLWFLTIFFVFGILTYYPSISCIFSFITALLILPVGIWQNLVGKVLKGTLKTILVVALALLAIFTAPSVEVDNTPDEVVESIVDSDLNTEEDSVIP